MEVTVPIDGRNGLREIDKETVSDVVEMVIYLICRNPAFDFNGLLPRRGEKQILNKVDFRMANNEDIKMFNSIILNNATKTIISDKKLCRLHQRRM